MVVALGVYLLSRPPGSLPEQQKLLPENFLSVDRALLKMSEHIKLDRESELHLLEEDEFIRVLSTSSSNDLKKPRDRLNVNAKNPLVLRLAALNAFHANNHEEGVRIATDAQKLSDQMPAEMLSRLPSESAAELRVWMASSALSRREWQTALKLLNDASGFDRRYEKQRDFVALALSETCPSDACLALANDISHQPNVSERPGLSINVDGTIKVNVATLGVEEEVQCRVLKLFPDNSLLVEYTDPRSSMTRRLLFPWKTVVSIHRGIEIESERKGLGMISWKVADWRFNTYEYEFIANRSGLESFPFYTIRLAKTPAGVKRAEQLQRMKWGTDKSFGDSGTLKTADELADFAERWRKKGSSGKSGLCLSNE